MEDLIKKATTMGANGVFGIGFKEILDGFIVITAVGTAVFV